MARRPRHTLRRVWRIASLVVTLLLVTAGVAFAAWSAITHNPGNSLGATSLAAPSNVNGTKVAGPGNGCIDVNVSWSAASAPVNTYVVEAKTATGPWTVVNGDTGDVTSISDTTPYTQSEVSYRVTGGFRTSGGTLTNWGSAQVIDATPLQCGSVSEVDDLVLAQGCMTAKFDWTLPAGANRFDRHYRINGGGWITTLDSTATTFTINSGIAPGDDVEFQVRPEFNTTVGNWTSIVTATDVDCVVENVTSVTSCTGSSVSYGSTQAGVAAYDREYSVNGAAAVASNDAAAVTWAPVVAGPNVVARVRGQNVAGTAGSWNTLAAADWGFFVKSVTLSNVGAGALALNAGDTAVVRFSRAVEPGTATATSIVTSNTNPRGIYLAATAAGLGTTQIGQVPAINNFWNASATYAGGAGTGFDATRTTWTWVSAATQAAVMDGPVTAGWSLGTSGSRALCDTDGTTALAATAPMVSGSF